MEIADAPRRARREVQTERRWRATVYRYPFDSPWVHATVRTLAERWLLPLWFLVLSARMLWTYATQAPYSFGFDVRLYRLAADAWLTGHDPWLPTLLWDRAHPAVGYAGPPPTLLPFILLAWIPSDVLILTFALVSGTVAVWTIRRLGLPLWWMLFPPIVEGIWVGNLNIFVIALLVAGGTVAGAIAAVLKVYAIVPMVLLGRWKPLIAAALIIVVTFPFLPWRAFFDEYPRISAALVSQAWGSTTSVLTSPLAIAGGAIGLAMLGRERAAWLAVPVLWPATQLHYTVLALPAMTPFLALFGAVYVPGMLGVGVMMYALWLRRDLVRSLLARRSGAGVTQPELAADPSP